MVLILLVLLTGATLAVMLWAGTAWFQAYIYSEPVAQLYWRAPAAGALLAAWVGLWAYLDYRHPDRFDTLFRFTAEDEKKFNEFWVERGKQKVHFEAKTISRGSLPGQVVFQEDRPPYRVWTRSDAVIVKEGEQEVRFEADKGPDGNYRVERGKDLHYRDAHGRVMKESSMGRVVIPRRGLLLANMGLNLFFFVLWFACLWLLLRFQWSHALGLAAIFWVAMIVIILPMLLTRASDVGAKRAPPAAPQTQARSRFAPSLPHPAPAGWAG